MYCVFVALDDDDDGFAVYGPTSGPELWERSSDGFT